MDIRKDLAFPLAIAIVGGTVAFFWPWLQTRQRGRRFEAIIWRELEEVGPPSLDEKTSKPWWELLTKRFIHEEIFRRDRISENRDFILSIDPTLVYLVNQLWIAFEKRQGDQWLKYLKELSTTRQRSSNRLSEAYDRWKRIIYRRERLSKRRNYSAG